MINKRIFGSDIPIMVKKKLEARQNLAEGDKSPNEIINSDYKDETSAGKATYKYGDLITSDFGNQADLSSRTAFARMWTAVALVRPLDVDIDELSDSDYDKLTEDEKKGFVRLGKKIYVLGTNNLSTIDSIGEIGQTIDNSADGYAVFPDEHGVKIVNDTQVPGNQFLKPQAGITSISSETGGTLGAIKTTEVAFTVHDFSDYDQIFNKYFLRPGAQLFVDFGWSSLKNKLYDPNDLLDNSKGFTTEQRLYGELEKDGVEGYVTAESGDLETLIGIVTGYDAKITENGSVECTVTLTSKNQALTLAPKLPTENQETSEAKFEYELDNLIKFEAVYNLLPVEGKGATRANVLEAMETANKSTSVQRQVEFEAYIDELAFNSFGGGAGDFNPTTLAMEHGVMLIGDDAVSSDQFLSWGILEDKIFNKYFGHGDNIDKINEGGDFEIKLDSSKSFTTYHQSFNRKQSSLKEHIPVFAVPRYWDRTWQSKLDGKTQKAGKTLLERKNDFLNAPLTNDPNTNERLSNAEFESKITQLKTDIDDFISKIDFNDDSTKYFIGENGFYGGFITAFDKNRYRVPIREIFVNTNIVKTAFGSKNDTFKSVVNEILDKINEESYGIWNWVLSSDGDPNVLSVIDTNHLGIAESKQENRFDQTFMFKVMSKDSIVTAYDVSFEMPDNEIGSMYAIQAMSGTSKEMYPVSTLIESQAALQALTSTVGDVRKLKFRYLPDLGTHYVERMNEDSEESNKYSSLYYDITDAIGESTPTNQGYGHNFDVMDKFETYINPNEDDTDTEARKKAIQAEIIERNMELNRDEGYIFATESERWQMEITKTYEKENLPKPLPFPMKLSLTTYGISTLKPGDTFRVDYLPQIYIDNVYFQVLSVSHDIGDSGWYTSLETQFRLKPENIDNPNIIGAPKLQEMTEGEKNAPVGKDSNGQTKTKKEKYGDPSDDYSNLAQKILVDIENEKTFKKIDDKQAYRQKKKWISFMTWTTSYFDSTYHIPTTGNMKNEGWATFKTKTEVKKDETFRIVEDFSDLKQYMYRVWDKSSGNRFKNIDFLYLITLKLPDDIDGLIISNPMYRYTEGWDKWNGYGYSPNFAKDEDKDSYGSVVNGHFKGSGTEVNGKFGYVRGIYRHGEQVWFGGRLNTGGGYGKNTHWFIAPHSFDLDLTGDMTEDVGTKTFGDGSLRFSLNELLRIYDQYPNQSFDNDWNFREKGGDIDEESGRDIST